MDDIPVRVSSNSPKFIDQFRVFLRRNRYAYATEKTYVYWVRYYINYHKKRHPKEMAENEIEQFLNFLSIERKCSPGTQATALNAIICMYTKFLSIKIEKLNYRNARPSQRVPVVFTRDEALSVFSPADA